MFALHFLPSSQSQSCFLFFAIPHIRHTIIIIARSLTRKAAELCHCVSYTLTQLLTCAHSNCISQRENERGEMNLEKVKFTHQPRLITDHWSALDIKPDNEDPWWWGNLLRSVPHIYFGLKIKSYQYLGHYGRFRFIHGSYWQGNIRPLLFEPKFHFLPLRNFLGHTVTNRFLQIVIVVWLITTS